MIVGAQQQERAALAVVSLGTSAHLERCLASFAAHESDTPFSLYWVKNSAGADHEPEISVPDHVKVIELDSNLGWAGGLHAARAATTAEFLVWVQEDSEARFGWLDALVSAADAHPQVAAFGSLAVDDSGTPAGFAGGMAVPPGEVGKWNETDTTAIATPTGVTELDWITSKGLRARTSAWDELGGADPRLFPLNHVDKDYCTHLRAHGYSVALVPSARLVHIGSLSAPGSVRQFVAQWQEPRFNQRWGSVVAAMNSRSGRVDHDCGTWFQDQPPGSELLPAVRRAVGAEAAAMVVPLGRWLSAINTRLATDNAELRRSYESSRSWRVTAPLRALSTLFRRKGQA